MLIASNLSKIYTYKEKKSIFHKGNVRRVKAVKQVSLKINQGKIIGLLGVNGAGKTTTIKMLSGIIEPTSGKITINNIDVIKEHMKIKDFTNVISGGERNIYWRLTARENLEYFGALYGISKNTLNQRIEYVLYRVGLGESKNIPVERYSKGMKQRLQIARGLINDPTYLFLDEPTLGLDITIAKELRNYIKKIANSDNKGILLTTHYISEAEELCDYIYVIDRGMIIAEGTPNELKRKLSTQEETVITIDSLNIQLKDELIKFGEKRGVKLNLHEGNDNIIKIISFNNCISEILQIIDNHGVSLLSMKLNEPTLENVLLTSILGGDTNAKVSKSTIC